MSPDKKGTRSNTKRKTERTGTIENNEASEGRPGNCANYRENNGSICTLLNFNLFCHSFSGEGWCINHMAKRKRG